MRVVLFYGYVYERKRAKRKMMLSLSDGFIDNDRFNINLSGAQWVVDDYY